MVFNPAYDHILVERSEDNGVTAGGIMLPTSAQEKQDLGTILAIGQGRLLDNGEIISSMFSVGDKVLFGAYAGQKIKLSGKDYIILKECEIFGTLC